MSYRVDNAVIMAAGTASRFAPLSYERPKALTVVRGEVLIERQIRQLLEAGIPEIMVVTGYKAEQFRYLREKFGVVLVENPEYAVRNNNASLYAVRNDLRNTYICSSDNYFMENPFECEVSESYYAALYADGKTREWCMTEDEKGYICDVKIGGENAWYMLGHAFWDENFSRCFVNILERIYDLPETAPLLWESIFMEHLDELKMKIRKYPGEMIYEFDTLDELRQFDPDYVKNTRSRILKTVAESLGCKEEDIRHIVSYKDHGLEAAGFRFQVGERCFEYSYEDQKYRRI